MTGPSQTRRLGDFELVKELEFDGMGSISVAVQISLGPRVTLKILALHKKMVAEAQK